MALKGAGKFTKTRYIKLGPTGVQKRGLSNKKNKGIEESVEDITRNQAIYSKRDSIQKSAHREGGKVIWSGSPPQQTAVPYLKMQEKKLFGRIDKVIKKYGALTEKSEYYPLIHKSTFKDMIQGQSTKEISYGPRGEIILRETNEPKVYNLSEANAIVRNFERAIDAQQKIKARTKPKT